MAEISKAGQTVSELRVAVTVDSLEVGRRVAPPIRLALHVPDSSAVPEKLTEAGAEILGGPVLTPVG